MSEAEIKLIMLQEQFKEYDNKPDCFEMTRNDKEIYINKCLEYCKEAKRYKEALNMLFGEDMLVDSGTLQDFLDDSTDYMMSLTSKIIGDDDEWLAWWILDNSFGENNYTAKTKFDTEECVYGTSGKSLIELINGR